MESIIESLQKIQENLVGIIIPVIVTAVISIVSLFVNTFIQVWMHKHQYKDNQHEIMRNLYPTLKAELIDIIILYRIVEANHLHKSDFSIINYVGCDWGIFRQKLSFEDIQCIDEFEDNIRKILDTYNKLYCFFSKNNIPTYSKTIRKKINDFQHYCAHIANSNHSHPPVDYNLKKLEMLLKKLDKYYGRL